MSGVSLLQLPLPSRARTVPSLSKRQLLTLVGGVFASAVQVPTAWEGRTASSKHKPATTCNNLHLNECVRPWSNWLKEGVFPGRCRLRRAQVVVIIRLIEWQVFDAGARGQ